MNLRSIYLYHLPKLIGNNIVKNFDEIKEIDNFSKEKLGKYQHGQLIDLVKYSSVHVPYYSKVMRDCGLVDKKGDVKIENYIKLPILTKEIIKSEGKNLYSDEYESRASYKNSSGGSTGEPAEFVQDKYYFAWNAATKLYFHYVLGKELGDKEIKFWGSDKDILEGTLGFKDNLLNRIYNRKFFNTYDFHSENQQKLIDLHNTFKPDTYWAYTDGMYEFAKIVLKNKVKVHKPKYIVVTINPLTEEIRSTIEKAFNCKVYDQYGSREVGPVAAERHDQNGLYTFPWNSYLEVLDSKTLSKSVNEGNLVITTLRNYSMPLLRYNIGDVVKIKTENTSNKLILDKILGRTLGYFKKKNGDFIHTHFIVQQMYYVKWVKRFKIIQDKFDHILIQIQKDPNFEFIREEENKMISNTKKFVGEGIDVELEYLEEIKPSKSGKYIYTECRV